MLRKAAILIATSAALAAWAAAPAFAATGWALQSTPNPSGATITELAGISCTSASFCIAVGDAETSGGALEVVVERWNGSTWALLTAPSPAGALLESVSCTSTTVCEAVGEDNAGSLAERWNGSTWATQTIPGSGMFGVSCTSSSNCEAVGNGNAVIWNGSNWTSQSISPPANTGFRSVSCSSASACTAVGTAYVPATMNYQGVAERWNGSTWSAQTFTQVAFYTEPSGVSCGSATSCVAVGYDAPKSDVPTALAEHWNGSTWTSQSVPDPGIQAGLDGISCVSGTSCIATGGYTPSSGALEDTLAESWNGSTWTSQSTPNPSGNDEAALAGVSCPSTTDCSAAGYWFPTTGINKDRSLAEQWTG